MTKVNFMNVNEKTRSWFEDLEIGEYFFEDDAEVSDYLYIKLPLIVDQYDRGLTRNAYNLNTKRLVFIGDKVNCIPVKEIDICIK